MEKIFAANMAFALLFLIFSVPLSQAAQDKGLPFLEGTADNNTDVFIYDGFRLTEIRKEKEIFSLTLPVTEGNYLVIFYTKQGRIPEIKVVKAGKDTVKMDRAAPDKPLQGNNGFLTGAVCTSVRGGKISFRKGILKLIEGADIELVNENGKLYHVKSEHNGIFGVSLFPGKYRLSMAGSKEKAEVVIKEGNTTVRNIRKGMVFVD